MSSIDTESSMTHATCIERLFTNPNPITPLLHVNSETRSFVLAQNFRNIESDEAKDFDMRRMFLRRHTDNDGHYPGGSSNTCRAVPVENRRYSLVDPENDIFFLGDPEVPGPDFILSTIDIMVRWMDKYCLDHIKRLAMPYYTWRKAFTGTRDCTLVEFKALDELFIIFVCCEVKPSTNYLHGIPNYVNPYFETVGPEVCTSRYYNLDVKYTSSGVPRVVVPFIFPRKAKLILSFS